MAFPRAAGRRYFSRFRRQGVRSPGRPQSQNGKLRIKRSSRACPVPRLVCRVNQPHLVSGTGRGFTQLPRPGLPLRSSP